MRKGIRVPAIICMVALAYIILDLPVRFSTFVNDLPPYLGIKNAVSPATGIILGPWGVIVSTLGALVSGILDKTSTWTQIIYEVITIVIEGLSIWFLWHLFTPNHKVRFKKITERYENNKEALFDAGMSYALSQIIDLLVSDTDGIHLYTMNNPRIARRICEGIRNIV